MPGGAPEEEPELEPEPDDELEEEPDPASEVASEPESGTEPEEEPELVPEPGAGAPLWHVELVTWTWDAVQDEPEFV
jgi:hypothetical protein